MKRFLLCALLLPALAPCQDVSLVVAAGANTSGSLCDPWQCAPRPVSAPRGATARLLLLGASFTPVLLVSATPAQCSPIAGIRRSLIVQPTATVVPLQLAWTRIYIEGPVGSSCGGWMGTASFPIPPGGPVGVAIVMQALSVNVGGPAFSNAVQLTIL